MEVYAEKEVLGASLAERSQSVISVIYEIKKIKANLFAYL